MATAALRSFGVQVLSFRFQVSSFRFQGPRFRAQVSSSVRFLGLTAFVMFRNVPKAPERLQRKGQCAMV